MAIGRPGQKELPRPIGDLIGSRCDQYTRETPAWDASAKTSPVVIPVAMPHMGSSERRQPEQVGSCRDCEFFVEDRNFIREGGFAAPFCRARGELLLPDRLTAYAKDCPEKSAGRFFPPPNYKIMFFPELQDGFGRPNLTDMLKGRSSDPNEYKSDLPVTPENTAMGIRAWRAVHDIEGYGPTVYLPIFNRGFFSEEIQETIPKVGDEEHPEDYVDYANMVYKIAVLWSGLDETPALWGPQGVGKTEIFRHMAFLMGLPFERLSIRPDTEVDELIGKMRFKPDVGTYFEYGRLPLFWQRANVMVIDEPNLGPVDVWAAIRPLTDNSKQMVIDQNSRERLSRHVSCYLGMAMNPAWDPRNVGANTLADADGARLMHVFMDYPPKDLERSILMKRLHHDGWDEASARKAVDLVMSMTDPIRELGVKGTVPVSWGIRSQIKAVRAMRYMHPLGAYRMASADALEPVSAKVILDIVRASVPENFRLV